MIIDLACTKPNGDFYYTSSLVVQDNNPDWPELVVKGYLLGLATVYRAEGYTVEITES